MATVLDDRVDIRRAVATAPAAEGPDDAGLRSDRRGWIGRGLVFVGLLSAFAVHIATYGAWVVDDAGISMAYAVNLAHGHGLVAQPGAAHVEAFSDPLWVGLLAATSRLGLLGGGGVFGVPGYVVVVKGLALAFHGVVLASLWIAIRRILTIVGKQQPPPALVLAAWAATGLVLAANPSYVVWMGSGLENPLFAAEVTAMAALAMVALPTPDRRALLGLGALAGAAALTRPDGLVYASAIIVMALLADVRGRRARAAIAGWGSLAFGAVFGTYLVFRLGYFHAWVPNTAVAKDQGLPTFADVARIDTIARAYGWPLLVPAVGGMAVASVQARRAANKDALRLIAAGIAFLGMGIAAYVVLPTDWMTELRFLTPVWPLLTTAAVLGVIQIAALARSRFVRLAVAVTLVLFGSLVLPSWRERANAFRASPTLPLCRVAVRYGTQLETVVRTLGSEPASTPVLLPDIGGVLLAADYEVVDLAGLADPAIARLLSEGTPSDLAGYVLDEVQPLVVHIHGDWVARSGLTEEKRFAAEYVDVNRGEDWVRRDAVAATADPAATLARIRAAAVAYEAPGPRSACGQVLFG